MNYNTIELPKLQSEIILSAFPGRQSDNTFSPEGMDQFFQIMQIRGCDVLISLVELHEFSDYISILKFKSALAKKNLKWQHHPLKDMSVPDETFMVNFAETQDDLIEILKSGGNIALHCMGGLGRSGTIAALLLLKLGFGARNSIEMVRSSRPGAIETKEQEQFILSINT